MMTLLGCIGMFILVSLLAILLLLGMFFSSGAGQVFTDTFNFVTTDLPAFIVLAVLTIIVGAVSILIQFGVAGWLSDRFLESNIPDMAQMLIILMALVPVPAFLFITGGLVYFWFDAFTVLLYAIPALLTIWAYIGAEYDDITTKKKRK